MDAGLRRDLEHRIRAGERLSREDGLALFACDDMAWLGGLAHAARTERHGDAAYFGDPGVPGDGAHTVECGDAAGTVDQVLRLRELQDGQGGVQAVVPRGTEVTGAEALRAFAVTRVLLENVPHVRVLWAAHGDQLAQLALQHGADDTDGPDPESGVTRDELIDLIRDAGFRPVERDGGYAELGTYDGPDPERRESPQPMRV
ncbi:hypothetical protein [Streptomyces sp. NPDC048172]|uniref:hypothetical protein n=1 Tax=Streptomyces sp. NPDC048172 TaxID=3365505 RepID=UPI003711D03D